MKCRQCAFFEWALRAASHPEDGNCFLHDPKMVWSEQEACYDARKRPATAFDEWRAKNDTETETFRENSRAGKSHKKKRITKAPE